MKISVVLPCRNEEESIGACIEKAKSALSGKDYEIIVSDSSTDRSAWIAETLGARVVKHEKGYGNACLEGFRHAGGDVIVMADTDGTYDLSEILGFLEKLSEGHDIVIGSRFGGDIEDGAMPRLHRYVGSPLFNFLLRAFFGLRLSDSHSGFRAVRREALDSLGLETTGMEFASEMLIKAKRKGLMICEIPISYRKRMGQSKMRSFRDGWRHLAFIMRSRLLEKGEVMQ